MANVASSTGLVEITEESVTVQRSRPLEFDPEKHKVLNSEFKYLYTAITRARVNVWFLDEDKESRAPVFEYFQRLGLVKVVAIGDRDAGSGELASMFAAKSTPEEWRKGGMRFYKHRLWVAAIQCFTFAGDKLMLQKSQAQQQAAEASKFRSTNRQQMRDEFLRAAESFLKCGMCDEAEICLNNAREWILLAKLYEKTGKVNIEMLNKYNYLTSISSFLYWNLELHFIQCQLWNFYLFIFSLVSKCCSTFQEERTLQRGKQMLRITEQLR